METYLQICEALTSYFAFTQSHLCTSCLETYYHSVSQQVEGIGHHDGHFNQLARSKQLVDFDDALRWSNDTEHGLFHGFCVGFLGELSRAGGYRFNEKLLFQHLVDKGAHQPISEPTMLFASALFHDFYRCVTGEAEHHDMHLARYFDGLAPITYLHSAPQDPKHPLIVGDRVELLRYTDHSEWVRREDVEAACTHACPWDLIDVFYKSFRPALEKIYKYRSEPWFKHGAEARHPCAKWHDPDFDKGHYPQAGTHMEVSFRGELKGYSVDTLVNPVGACTGKNHGAEYQIFGGIIPVRHIRAAGAGAVPCELEKPLEQMTGFEHPALVGYPELEKWVFWYCIPLETNKYRDLIEDLIARDIAVLPLDLLRRWWQTSQQLFARSIALVT